MRDLVSGMGRSVRDKRLGLLPICLGDVSMVDEDAASAQRAFDDNVYRQGFDEHRGVWRNGPEPKRRGRLARSAACRSWYHWRWYAKHEHAPLWVTLAPPWPVVRLACRMTGRSTLLAALSMPFALLASSGLDESACLDIRQDSGVKSDSGWARLFRKIGARPSSA